ncbi:hypothetical protein EME01_60180 [Sinorhizobium meliloti]|nr:hypothetical protein EME01_60180 [Sinorhizobium meliloti]
MYVRICSISKGPSIDPAKPGKFSTSVVMMTWPPARLTKELFGVDAGNPDGGCIIRPIPPR